MYGFAALRVGWPGRFRVRQPLSSQDRANAPQRRLSPDERRQPKRSVIKITARQPRPTVCASLMCRCSAATPPQGDVLRHMSDVFGQVCPDWQTCERPSPSRNVAPGSRACTCHPPCTQCAVSASARAGRGPGPRPGRRHLHHGPGKLARTRGLILDWSPTGNFCTILSSFTNHPTDPIPCPRTPVKAGA